MMVVWYEAKFIELHFTSQLIVIEEVSPHSKELSFYKEELSSSSSLSQI